MIKVLQHGCKPLGRYLMEFDRLLLLLLHVVTEHRREIVAGFSKNIAVCTEQIFAHLEFDVAIVVIHFGLHLVKLCVDILVFVV